MTPGLQVPEQFRGPWESAAHRDLRRRPRLLRERPRRNSGTSAATASSSVTGRTSRPLCEDQSDGHLRHLNLRYLAAGIYMPAGRRTREARAPAERRGRAGCSWAAATSAPGLHATPSSSRSTNAAPSDRAARRVPRRARTRRGARRPRLCARAARRQIRDMWDEAPWLAGTSDGASRVRHNLDRSFLDQLSDAVAGSAACGNSWPWRPSSMRRPGALRGSRPPATRASPCDSCCSADRPPRTRARVLGVLGEFAGRAEVELFDVR